MSLEVVPNQMDLSKSEEYILNKLKRLYENSNNQAFLYLQPKIKNLVPDFILIDSTRGVAIIEVKAWSKDYINKINNNEVSTTDGKTHKNPAFRSKQYFNVLKSILTFNDLLLNDEAEFKYNLSSNLFFTELEEIKDISNFFNHYPTRVFYKDNLRKLSIKDIFDNKQSNIENNELNIIRSLIFPEIKIGEDNNINIDEVIKALDIKQESFVKRKPKGHYHISGIPGSGKTVMLIARAIYLLKINPNWQIAIITYNKSLSKKIENRLNSLDEELKFMDINISNIEVKSFHSFAYSIAPINSNSYIDKDDFFKNILPNEALKKVTPQYEALLIDEYQDFYKHWFELCIKSIKKDNENNVNLLLAGDRLQSIYNPNEINWKQDIGLDMRGHSMLLKSSYRTSKEHIDLAVKVLMSDEKLKKEVEKFYEGKENINSINNKQNSLMFIEGNYFNVIEEIEKKLNIGYKPEDFLVLSNSWDSIKAFFNYLPENIQKYAMWGKEIRDNKMIITTYHSSKGLENKIAVLLNINEISEDKKLAYVGMTRASEYLIIQSNTFKVGLAKEIITLNSNK